MGIHMKKIPAILTGILLLAAVIAPKAVHAGTAPRPNELVIALNNEPVHFNPALHSGTLTGLVGTQLFAGLIRCNAQGKPEPYLASSWEISPDRLTYTFHLRPNALFHDLSPITADDVKFSLETVRDQHPFSSMLSGVADMKTPDSRTLVLTLDHPHPALLQVLTPALTPIMPRRIYGNGQNIQTHPANWKPVGSGPFQFIRQTPGRRIILKKFDHFFLPGRPLLDRVIFSIFPGPEDIPLAIENGEVHLTAFAPSVAHHNQLAQSPGLTVSHQGFQGIGAMLWLGFNLREKPFSDLRVRQALALALDKPFIQERILGPGSQPMDGPIVPDSPFYAPPDTPDTMDVQRANRLLDQAGYHRDENGRRMVVELTAPPDGTSLTRPLITYLRHHLIRTVGVEIRPREYPDLASWGRRLSNGTFQASLDIVFSWYDPVIGIHRTYLSSNIRRDISWSNTLGFKDPQVDRLLQKAGQQIDPKLRRPLYREFQQRIRSAQPVIWLGTMPYATIYDRRLKGLNTSLWGLISPLDQVRWEKTAPTSPSP